MSKDPVKLEIESPKTIENYEKSCKCKKTRPPVKIEKKRFRQGCC